MKAAWYSAIHVVFIGALTLTACAVPSASKATLALTAPLKPSVQRLSQGCGRETPKTPATSLRVAGRPRKFILVVPKGYRSHQPHRLVFAFHGRTNSNAKVRGYYDLERHATQPTLFVYPSGLKDQSGRFTCFATTCNGAVAAMIVHNPKDRLVPFPGGRRARDTFLKYNGLLEVRAVSSRC
ncbi:hypothetical protein C2W62_04810 [Candidatus Entotheonella serta]|nr:hypothetical protein C2W62_04810 [Candidatus Entotheonella serta]